MRAKALIGWLLLGVAAVALLVYVWPQVFPLTSPTWNVSRSEARDIALARFSDLGPAVEKPYVVVGLDDSALVERRLDKEAQARGLAVVRRTGQTSGLINWLVAVYKPGALPRKWTYLARIGMGGEVLALQLQVPAEQEGGAIGAEEARRRADRFLADQGFDVAAFEAPEVRSQQLKARTDTTLRYRYREQLLGDKIAYGVEVGFAGDQLTGYQRFFDDPGEAEIKAEVQPAIGLSFLHIVAVLLLLPFVAVIFVRRYHAGEVGIRRGGQVFALVFGTAVVLIAMSARATSENVGIYVLSRAQTTWAYYFQIVLLFFLPLALLVFLSWSVGESLCRERWGGKLAALDALLRGRVGNATVARSALRGTVAGVALVALLAAVTLLLRPTGAWPLVSFQTGPWWPNTSFPGVALLGFCLAFALYGELFGRLFLLSLATPRLGRWGGGALAALATALLVWGIDLPMLPMRWSLLLSVAVSAALVALFLRYDLLTTLVASLVGQVLLGALPLLFSVNAGLALQGWIAVVGAGLPFLLSARFLGSGEEFQYRYDDIAPHVRRIAERERQRVELETARNIQSSILPELPPRLAGVDIAYSYLPASEVGGDFYDVLALEDGRLALAVGDVAGHGVSSGLVMSMAKSALAVQVTFDPEVGAVFGTLNRMVYQSARKRLLTTLCYALLDPKRRELSYASAGHLFPYRVAAGGRVTPLHAASYPLGVRTDIEVEVRNEKLDPGDTLVMFSDGLVEARREASDELFGFERLEESLGRHAGESVEGMRDGLLAEIWRFSGNAPREDDQTVLVLRIP